MIQKINGSNTYIYGRHAHGPQHPVGTYLSQNRRLWSSISHTNLYYLLPDPPCRQRRKFFLNQNNIISIKNLKTINQKKSYLLKQEYGVSPIKSTFCFYQFDLSLINSRAKRKTKKTYFLQRNVQPRGKQKTYFFLGR